jgi:hypothetical protein
MGAEKSLHTVIAPAAVLDTALKVIEETANNPRKENQDCCNH